MGLSPLSGPPFPGASTNPGPQPVDLARLGLGALGSAPLHLHCHTASADTPTSADLLVCKLRPVIPSRQVRVPLGEML